MQRTEPPQTSLPLEADQRVGQRLKIRLPVALLILSATGVAGAALILWSTPWGVGIVHDSLFYFSAAENLAFGRGLFWAGGGGELKPLVHFPPL